jgi:hypothetical protein
LHAIVLENAVLHAFNLRLNRVVRKVKIGKRLQKSSDNWPKKENLRHLFRKEGKNSSGVGLQNEGG